MAVDFESWLQDTGAIRCILVEASVNTGSEITRYLSSRPYQSGGTLYNPVVIGSSVRLTERIDVLSDSASMSFGDIELDNTGGALDPWLQDIWSNRTINVLIGDVRWDRSDFEVIFSGVVEDIGSRSQGVINLKLRDKLQRLNVPVTEATLGGSTANKDQLIPLTFGECHNVSPLLIDPATLEYQVHDGPIERVIEVRDEGVPVSSTVNLSTGKFTLTVQPFGRITASVQGDKPSTWINTAANLIVRLVTSYGSEDTKLTIGDLDQPYISAFDALNPQPLGVYLPQRENLLSICTRIAASVGARLVMSREGKLRIVKVDLPATGAAVEIGPKDIIEGTMRMEQKLPVSAGVTIAYCKNWTVQDNIDTRIPSAHKDLYAREWLLTTAKDDNVKEEYRIEGDPPQKDTYLLTEVDASAEANRILSLFDSPRYIVSFEATSRLLTLELGQAVTITHKRYGMGSGKSGMVVGLSPDWGKSLINVSVLI